MVMKLDQLVNGAINVGFGAAAVAVEGSKKVLDDLNTKGEQVRKDAGSPRYRPQRVRHVRTGRWHHLRSDRALGHAGRDRGPARARRAHFGSRPRHDRPRAHGLPGHVRDIVDSVEDNVTSVPVESVEPDDAKDTEEAE